ncbi:hypothetical protein CLOSTHATH_06547, partial [Hungatella hathewayi DSM 13479]
IPVFSPVLFNNMNEYYNSDSILCALIKIFKCCLEIICIFYETIA